MTREELIAEAKRRYHPIREGDWFEGNRIVTHNPMVHYNMDEWAVLGDTIYSMPPGEGGYVVLISGNWATKKSMMQPEKVSKNLYRGVPVKLEDLVGMAKEKRSVCFKRGFEWAISPAAFMVNWPLAQLAKMKIYTTEKQLKDTGVPNINNEP